ncbi:MAG: alpha/beta hydrolase [Bacteroidales bacterium]|jgi:pimeloyl-ACP methyl ester carboxylesterase|nr:alpha/beta hydrolase [Bacteroidales bacterium]
MIHSQVIFNRKVVNYQDAGPKEGTATIVFLHGFMNDLDIWHYYVVEYMKKCRIIAIDLLGHGESSVVSEEHTMDMQAAMVKTVLDAANVKNCVIVGHSMGGYVALAFAQMYPQYMQGLCLLHSHSLPDREDEKQSRYEVCESVDNNRTGFILSFVPNLFAECNREELHQAIGSITDSALKTSAEGIIAAEMGMVKRTSKIGVLTDSTYPILFIFGKQDKRIPIELGLVQAMLPAHSEVLILDNVGHMAHVEAREVIRKRLWSFLVMCYSQE